MIIFILGIIAGAVLGWFFSWGYYAYPDNREEFLLRATRKKLQRRQIEAELEFLDEEISESLNRRMQG